MIAPWFSSVLAFAMMVGPGSAHWVDGSRRSIREPQPTCVRAWSEARYSGAGYDHLVYVASDCDAPISCATWTDVNPEPQALSIAPGETVGVLTFRGSPA